MTKAMMLATLLLLLSPFGHAQSGNKAKNVAAEDKKNLEMAKKSQQRIDGLSDQTQTLLMKYRQTLKQMLQLIGTMIHGNIEKKSQHH